MGDRMMQRTKEYRQKRDFSRTPEPAGDGPAEHPVGALRFVVQKHDATRLHFDLRLELDGVFKSWAVTNQPTSVVGSRRLAVQVEDHPLEYGSFEGEIPEGEYGAGSVVIWDSGTWRPEGDAARGLRDGKLNFSLDGSILQGRWTLVRFGQRSTRTARKDNWLLIKRHEATRSRRVAGGVKRRMANVEEPQLATLVASVPTASDWWFEPKLDGYRLLARIDGDHVRLATRNGNDWTDRFPQISAALRALPCRRALLDGEVVVFDTEGVSRFQRLQAALKDRRGEMVYVVFDLLHLDEWELRDAPLSARKAALRELLSGVKTPLRYGDHLESGGDAMFRAACELGLEGIIAKRANAPYRPGRTASWLKIKCMQEQEFVIVGYTEPNGARHGFGALLLATRDQAGGPLRFAGRVGSGFDRGTLHSLYKQLTARETARSAVTGVNRRNSGSDVHWVKPELVAVVSFTGWTDDQHLRHPVFQGLREDKAAKDVLIERPAVISEPVGASKPVRLTNPGKLLFTDPPITKRDLAAYWKEVAPLTLPYLMERPLSLLRCPDGIAQCFYQKHIGGSAPENIPTVAIDDEDEPYAVVDGANALRALVQWGAIELHPWGSRATDLDRPDTLVFDLDPSPELPWPAVVDGAAELKARIEALGLIPFAKLTGGKGIHLVVPVQAGPDWKSVKAFARALATELARAEPAHFTVSISKSQRTGKIFIDYLRNDRESTAIAPYSPRARVGAPIAAPVDWSELLEARTAQPVITLETYGSVIRSHKRRHPWAEYEEARRSLTE
jgi:bifunctional non-homologous end joining protein LigD